MLTQEGPAEAPRLAVKPRKPWAIPVLVVAFLGVLVMRHDFWQWRTAEPLLLGFLPVGLWWQALVSVAASLFMWLCVTLAWPGHLEVEAIEFEQKRLGTKKD